jgi:hypothetical protein
MVYTGLKFIIIGMFISELGSESSLKLVVASDGLSGLILCEQEAIRVVTIAEIIIPFMLFIYEQVCHTLKVWHTSSYQK